MLHCRQQLASEASRAEAAAAAAAEADAVWQEVLLQTEEDLEQQAERDGERLAAARHEAGEVRRLRLLRVFHLRSRLPRSQPSGLFAVRILTR